MKKSDNYAPPRDGGAFVVKTINSIGLVLSRLKVQRGHEKEHALPAVLKLFIVLSVIVLISVTQSRLLLIGVLAVTELYLSTWPAEDILSIVKACVFAAVLAFIIMLPAMILKPYGIGNNLIVILKVFLSVELMNIFNHTTQWNHITGALRKIHIPGIFVFTLDITLKYIVLLGTLINDLLTSLRLRSVGKNNKKYQSVGGVMGVTFMKSTEMSKEMYEAMVCRGFTDDYSGL